MLKNPETPRGVNTYMYMYHVYTSLADAMPAFSSCFSTHSQLSKFDYETAFHYKF